MITTSTAATSPTFEMTSLFGEGDTEDFQKLLSAIPTSSPVQTSEAVPTGSEDLWMSTWLKDEPVVQGASIF